MEKVYVVNVRFERIMNDQLKSEDFRKVYSTAEGALAFAKACVERFTDGAVTLPEYAKLHDGLFTYSYGLEFPWLPFPYGRISVEELEVNGVEDA